MTGGSDSPIEDYLDQLLGELSGHPRQIRFQLAEAEGHLRDAADAAMARGLDPSSAERDAVARFGSPVALAREERTRQMLPWTVLGRRGVWSALWLGGLAGVAVGASAILTDLFAHLWGARFVVGTPPAEVRTPANCSRWLAGSGLHTCAQAATADWAGDVVWTRLAVGVLGLLALAVWALLRRRAPRSFSALPAQVVDTVAAVAFGGAGLWLAGRGIDALLVRSGHGAGQWLGPAPVALAAGAVFALRLLRDLRRPLPGVLEAH